jgi:hypothetical protein
MEIDENCGHCNVVLADCRDGTSPYCNHCYCEDDGITQNIILRDDREKVKNLTPPQKRKLSDREKDRRKREKLIHQLYNTGRPIFTVITNGNHTFVKGDSQRGFFTPLQSKLSIE